MVYYRITNFVDGLNTRDDARRLKPNTQNQSGAESPEIVNVEVDAAGALITSKGFTKYVELGTGKPVQALFEYKAKEKQQLIAVSDNKIFLVNTVEKTVTEVGVLPVAAKKFGGVSMVTEQGLVFLLGTDTNKIIQIKDDATMTTLNNSPQGAYIMTVALGRLFVATDTLVQYSAVENPNTWAGDDAGNISFNDVVTGLGFESKRVIVFTRSYHQAIFFDYNDSFNISQPLKEPNERRFGGLGHNCIDKAENDIFYLAENLRVYKLGAEEYTDEAGLPRVVAVSDTIDPSLQKINEKFGYRAIVKYFNKQLFVCVPYNTSSDNNVTFVWNQQWGSWISRLGFSISGLCKSLDETENTGLFFGTPADDKIYLFDSSYSYNGQNYRKTWKSKKYTLGDASVFKEYKWVDISGAFPSSTTLYVELTVDTDKVTYILNNKNLELTSEGGVIGDDFIGDFFLGGIAPEDSFFKRFKAHLQLPDKIREGHELQVKIYNKEAGHAWKIDEIGVDFEPRPRKQRNPRYFVNDILPN